MFRKPKKSIRSQRKILDSDEEEENNKDFATNQKHRDYDHNGSSVNNSIDSDEIKNLKEIQSNISKFKEGKLDKKKKKANKGTGKAESEKNTKTAGSTLSFEQELEGG